MQAADAAMRVARPPAPALVHVCASAARARLAARKRALACALRRPDQRRARRAGRAGRRRALVAALQAQFPLALIDEFQDTDARQWAIFDRAVRHSDGGRRGLFLVGDPKQAIYRFRGGDVHTYLQAREARGAPALDRNFRSRPR